MDKWLAEYAMKEEGIITTRGDKLKSSATALSRRLGGILRRGRPGDFLTLFFYLSRCFGEREIGHHCAGTRRRPGVNSAISEQG